MDEFDSRTGYMPQGHNTLVFQDDFLRLDRDVWTLRGNDPWGDGMTHADASYKASQTGGGKLHMRLLKGDQGLLTAHLGTMHSFQFYQGYAEARMRFYPHHGMHASFWLQSEAPYEPGRPEIDVVEYFGAHNPERKSGINVFHNVYYRNQPEDEILRKGIVVNSNTFNANWFKEYHNYGVLWNDLGYHFFIDRKKVGSVTGVKDDSKKFLILSNLVRDYEYPYIAEHPFDTYKTTVDWVRVWQ